MNENLAVHDPLADRPVTILITLAPDHPRRAKRTATVTVGVPGEPPVFKRGPFEEVVDLIHQAWLAFGVRRQVAAATTPPTTVEPEMVAAASVVVAGPVASGTGGGATSDRSRPARPPEPQPKNLTLF